MEYHMLQHANNLDKTEEIPICKGSSLKEVMLSSCQFTVAEMLITISSILFI